MTHAPDDDPQMLYRIAPGERLEVASTIPLEPGESTEPEATAVSYDVLIPVEGSGYVTWDDERVELARGMYVAVPPEATYTITANPDQHLKVMVIGISSTGQDEPNA
jgi:mannose-6-phosphate isomerase-like protein (cupin superfamily)